MNVEENALSGTLGSQYTDYMRRTKRLVPFVLLSRKADGKEARQGELSSRSHRQRLQFSHPSVAQRRCLQFLAGDTPASTAVSQLMHRKRAYQQ